MNNLERDSKQYDVLVMETSTQMRDSDWCVPVKHVAKLNRMKGQTSTKANIKFFVDPEEENRDNDTTLDCLGSKQSEHETMSITIAVVVRLVTLSGNEREVSSPRRQVYVFQLDRCRHQFLREEEYRLVRASTEHLGAVAKASGYRFRSLSVAILAQVGIQAPGFSFRCICHLGNPIKTRFESGFGLLCTWPLLLVAPSSSV